MKKYFIVAMITVLGASVTFTSCKKYEDGPAISLLTKKMRLTGDWTLDKYYDGSGADQTAFVSALFGSAWEFQIEKDGNFKQTGNVNTSGTWKLGEDKDDVSFTESNGTTTTYRILKLKNKELWLRYTNSLGQYEKLYLKQ